MGKGGGNSGTEENEGRLQTSSGTFSRTVVFLWPTVNHEQLNAQRILKSLFFLAFSIKIWGIVYANFCLPKIWLCISH